MFLFTIVLLLYESSNQAAVLSVNYSFLFQCRHESQCSALVHKTLL